jgi:diguanylate cyclase (GGDEF)-like protein
VLALAARRWDLAVLGLFLVLVPVYLLLPDGADAYVGYAVIVGVCSLAVLLAVAVSPARHPWLLMAAAQLLFTAAEAEVVRLKVTGADYFPSAADGFFLVGDVVLFAAVLRLLPAPRGGMRRGPLLDTLVVTVSVGMLFVVYTVVPAFAAQQSLEARLIAAAYPLVDIVIVFLLVRATGWRSGRPAAFWYLAVGLACTVVADVAFAVLTSLGHSDDAPRWVEIAWLGFYACIAAAAASPSATDLGHPPVERRPESQLVRLPLLAVAALLPPVAIVIEHAFHEGDHALALGFATIIVVGLVLLRVWDLLRIVRGQAAVVERLADTDPLTGLPNRRAWDAEVARTFATGQPVVTVAIVDLDHFKAFNDTHGHEGGDDLLVAAAHLWGQALPGVFIARWGGEEFTLLLPGVGGSAAIGLLRAVHERVPRGQTCSIGVATWNGAEVPPAVLARADAALYRAKRTGRNRTVLAGGRAEAGVDVLPGVG